MSTHSVITFLLPVSCWALTFGGTSAAVLEGIELEGMDNRTMRATYALTLLVCIVLGVMAHEAHYKNGEHNSKFSHSIPPIPNYGNALVRLSTCPVGVCGHEYPGVKTFVEKEGSSWDRLEIIMIGEEPILIFYQPDNLEEVEEVVAVGHLAQGDIGQILLDHGIARKK
jgi:hypothetical protein